MTLFVSVLMSTLTYIELSIQGREHWVLGWFILLVVLLFVRWRDLQAFLTLDKGSYFPTAIWHRKFHIGATLSGLMLGLGAALVMPYITLKLQIILHSLLLVMGAGSIAYLSTSLRVYNSYLLAIILPITVWLFFQHKSETYLLSFLYLFFMIAGFVSVKRMNELVNDALYYRYDNETLIDDLQRLLQSVSKNNKALEKISLTDELTGVANYRAFRVHLEEIWADNQSSGLPISLIRMNLDFYHEFNAGYGQQVGDDTLKQVSTIVAEELSHPGHLLARTQGAEFALLMPGVKAEEAGRNAEKIVRNLAAEKIEHRKSPVSPYLTLSIGIGAQRIKAGSSSAELLLRADTALKLASEKGHNRIEVLEN